MTLLNCGGYVGYNGVLYDVKVVSYTELTTLGDKNAVVLWQCRRVHKQVKRKYQKFCKQNITTSHHIIPFIAAIEGPTPINDIIICTF